MPLLARLALKPNLWAIASEESRWQGDDFPFEAISEIFDTKKDGLSVWEVQSPDDPALKRIIAAYSVLAGKKSVDKAEVRFVEPDTVRRLGVAMDEKPGRLADKDVNSLHRNILEATAPQAIALLRALALSQRGRTYSQKDVANFVLSSFKSGHLPAKEFPPTEACFGSSIENSDS